MIKTLTDGTTVKLTRVSHPNKTGYFMVLGWMHSDDDVRETECQYTDDKDLIDAYTYCLDRLLAIEEDHGETRTDNEEWCKGANEDYLIYAPCDIYNDSRKALLVSADLMYYEDGIEYNAEIV